MRGWAGLLVGCAAAAGEVGHVHRHGRSARHHSFDTLLSDAVPTSMLGRHVRGTPLNRELRSRKANGPLRRVERERRRRTNRAQRGLTWSSWWTSEEEKARFYVLKDELYSTGVMGWSSNIDLLVKVNPYSRFAQENEDHFCYEWWTQYGCPTTMNPYAWPDSAVPNPASDDAEEAFEAYWEELTTDYSNGYAALHFITKCCRAHVCASYECPDTVCGSEAVTMCGSRVPSKTTVGCCGPFEHKTLPLLPPSRQRCPTSTGCTTEYCCALADQGSCAAHACSTGYVSKPYPHTIQCTNYGCTDALCCNGPYLGGGTDHIRDDPFSDNNIAGSTNKGGGGNSVGGGGTIR